MAASGYTPIILLNSTTTGNTPTTSNLAVGELAINVTDGKLFFNQSGTIKVLANATYATSVSTISFGTTGLTPSTATNGVVTVAGTLATTNGGTGLTSFTSGGVVYASSTSALATGSALTFDGTLLTLPRLGQSGAGNYGYFNTTSAGNGFLSFQYNSSEVGEIGQGSGIISGGSNTDFGIRATNNLVFGISYNEQMRLNSTGLGIGTSSPGAKLDVYSTSSEIARIQGGSAGAGYLRFADTTNTNIAYVGRNNTSDLYIWQQAAGGSIRFGTVNSQVAQFDASGNLGLGVTPSAWSVGKTIQLGGAGSAFLFGGTSAGTNTSYGINAYFNSGWKYGDTGYATRYAQDASTGSHSWFTAASGTAGNAITFTQAMTLDASGNLGVGTTSALSRIDARAASATMGNYQTIQAFSTDTSAAIDLGGGISLGGYYNSTQVGQFGSIVGRKENGTSSNYAGYLAFGTNSQATGVREVMRLDSSGNLLVGTTSNPAGVKLVIGGTSGTARIEPAVDNVGYIGEGSYRWQAVYAVNGTIQTSDGREKNTIADSNLGLSFVQSLRPVSYKWNVGENVVTYDEEGKEVVTPRAGVRTHYGFIAQEVQAAIPEGVDFGGFVQEPNEGMMSLRYHEFIGPLVKAIQEQQALIQSLKADFDAYKASHP